jgi:hypothetical protein
MSRLIMSRLIMNHLKALLHVATPSTCNMQQTVLQVCRGVAQHVQQVQHLQHHEGATVFTNPEKFNLQGEGKL